RQNLQNVITAQDVAAHKDAELSLALLMPAIVLPALAYVLRHVPFREIDLKGTAGFFSVGTAFGLAAFYAVKRTSRSIRTFAEFMDHGISSRGKLKRDDRLHAEWKAFQIKMVERVREKVRQSRDLTITHLIEDAPVAPMVNAPKAALLDKAA